MSGRVLAKLPERESLKRCARRERRKNAPANPKSIDDLEEIPELYRKTCDGDNFLLYDSRAHDELPGSRVLIFSTRRNIEVLGECRDWYVDGTFKVCPTLFTQLFTVLGGVPAVPGDHDSATVPLPLAYALLSSKREVEYRTVLDAINNASEEYGIEELDPTNIHSDFETAIINAVSGAFPEVNIDLCYFHLKQSAYRHVVDLGLKVRYTRDPIVRDYFHMMAALAYVPVQDVKVAYRALIRTTPDVPRLDEFNDYFGKTYVVGVRGAGQRPRVPPLYEPQLWNLYEATLEGRATTNNASEGWHNRFMTILQRKHPDMYSLLDALKKEQGDTQVAILELRLGRNIKAAPKKKWIEYQARVRTTVRSYETYGVANILEYLRLVSYHISFD